MFTPDFCQFSLDLPPEPCNNYPVQQDEFGGVSSLAEVRLQEGESLENALRRFKRKVQQEDLIKEVRRHSFYLKPGEKMRVKEALARKSRIDDRRVAGLSRRTAFSFPPPFYTKCLGCRSGISVLPPK
jgi:small subunit ribosomal protein S21